MGVTLNKMPVKVPLFKNKNNSLKFHVSISYILKIILLSIFLIYLLYKLCPIRYCEDYQEIIDTLQQITGESLTEGGDLASLNRDLEIWKNGLERAELLFEFKAHRYNTIYSVREYLTQYEVRLMNSTRDELARLSRFKEEAEKNIEFLELCIQDSN